MKLNLLFHQNKLIAYYLLSFDILNYYPVNSTLKSKIKAAAAEQNINYDSLMPMDVGITAQLITLPNSQVRGDTIYFLNIVPLVSSLIISYHDKTGKMLGIRYSVSSDLETERAVASIHNSINEYRSNLRSDKQ